MIPCKGLPADRFLREGDTGWDSGEREGHRERERERERVRMQNSLSKDAVCFSCFASVVSFLLTV